MSAKDRIAQELRWELDARVRGWKQERKELLRSAARVTELDELIAAADTDDETFAVAARAKPAAIVAEDLTK